jgi:hypothetical protein
MSGHDCHEHECECRRHCGCEHRHAPQCRIVLECRCHDDKPDHCDGGGNGGGGSGGGGSGDGTVTVGWNNPGRPGHTTGTSAGDVPGGRLTPGDFDPRPPNQWPGNRGDMYLPFLYMRTNPGDLGARPAVGPFWESPDILLLAGVDPAGAPPKPPELGQNATAGQPNTLYAHIWNFGIAAAPNVIVEFYWCNPTLGIGPAGANLIGQTVTSLGARGSGRAHAVVKCPVAWVPTFVNGGHECLVVRIWDETSDGLGTPPWDAALNRHVAQRNIHVVSVTNQARLLTPDPARPVTLTVGPLFGEPATVGVERVAPHQMPWLQLRTGTRGVFPAAAAPTGNITLSAPVPVGGGMASTDSASVQQVRTDDQQLTFTTGDAAPSAGQAHVYRVSASQQGQVFGGYTVVLIG